jgi:WD40 repeat protein
MLLKKTLSNNGDENIQSVAFSAKSDMVIAGSIEDKVSMWDVNKPGEKPVKSYKGVDEWIRGVGFTADGKRAVMFDTESRVVIVDARSGTEITRVEYSKLKGDKDFLVEAGVVGPDGTVLIATRAGELLHLYAKPPGR